MWVASTSGMTLATAAPTQSHLWTTPALQEEPRDDSATVCGKLSGVRCGAVAPRHDGNPRTPGLIRSRPRGPWRLARLQARRCHRRSIDLTPPRKPYPNARGAEVPTGAVYAGRASGVRG